MTQSADATGTARVISRVEQAIVDEGIAAVVATEKSPLEGVALLSRPFAACARGKVSLVPEP